MILKVVQDVVSRSVVDEDGSVFTCRRQFCPIVRVFEIPDFVRVVFKIQNSFRREVFSLAVMVEVKRRRVSGVVVETVVDPTVLDLV